MIYQFAQSFPIVGITGPRQSGKTTLAQTCFPKKPYISLEDPDQQYKIRKDPRGFLAHYIDGAIFDEIQHIPELLSYLQGIVDADDTPGRFVITGSQNFALSDKVSQSLAGRIGMATLCLLLFLSAVRPQVGILLYLRGRTLDYTNITSTQLFFIHHTYKRILSETYGRFNQLKI